MRRFSVFAASLASSFAFALIARASARRVARLFRRVNRPIPAASRSSRRHFGHSCRDGAAQHYRPRRAPRGVPSYAVSSITSKRAHGLCDNRRNRQTLFGGVVRGGDRVASRVRVAASACLVASGLFMVVRRRASRSPTRQRLTDDVGRRRKGDDSWATSSAARSASDGNDQHGRAVRSGRTSVGQRQDDRRDDRRATNDADGATDETPTESRRSRRRPCRDQRRPPAATELPRRRWRRRPPSRFRASSRRVPGHAAARRTATGPPGLPARPRVSTRVQVRCRAAPVGAARPSRCR
jgi:hypothetical protein